MNIGTLFAFVLVSIGVIVLRRTRPDLPRAFRVPLVPFLPIVSALACLYLMLNLPGRDLDPVRASGWSWASSSTSSTDGGTRGSRVKGAAERKAAGQRAGGER